AAGEQFTDKLHVPPFRRRDERDSAIAIREPRVGVGIEGESDDVEEPFRAGKVQRIVDVVVANIDVSPRTNEGGDRLRLVGIRRPHDRGPTLLILYIDRCTVPEEIEDVLRFATLSREEQLVVNRSHEAPLIPARVSSF